MMYQGREDLFSLTVIPVSVFEGITSVQPLFVLFIAVASVRYRPQLLKDEAGDPRRLLGKVILFVLMTIGTVLIIRPK